MNRHAKKLTKHAAEHLQPGEQYEVAIVATPPQPKYAPLLLAFGGLGVLLGQALAKRRMKNIPPDMQGTWAASLMTVDALWLGLTDSRLIAVRGNTAKPRELHVEFGLENVIDVRRNPRLGTHRIELDLIDDSTVSFDLPSGSGMKQFIETIERRTVSA